MTAFQTKGKHAPRSRTIPGRSITQSLS